MVGPDVRVITSMVGPGVRFITSIIDPAVRIITSMVDPAVRFNYSMTNPGARFMTGPTHIWPKYSSMINPDVHNVSVIDLNNFYWKNTPFPSPLYYFANIKFHMWGRRMARWFFLGTSRFPAAPPPHQTQLKISEIILTTHPAPKKQISAHRKTYIVWPIFFLMNVFIALKGTHFLNFISD